MRGLKSTIALLVVLLGLGAYIYFVESKRPDTPVETKEKVFTVESDKIQEITVKAAAGDRTTLQKVNNAWQVTAPVNAKADETEASGLTSNLSSLEIQRVVEDAPSDLKPYGLAEPRVEIAFKTAEDKEPRRLLMGEKTATGGDLYAKLATDKKVFLISGYLDNTFNRTTFELRDKTVLRFERDKIDLIQIRTPEHTVQLTKADAEWKLAEPVQARGDFGTIEGVIGRLNTAQMKSIVAAETADLKQYGLDKPEVTTTLGAGSSRTVLEIGKKADESNFYARDASRPMVFTIESSLIDELKKPPADFRRKDLFEFRPFNATALDITRDGQTFAFQKVKGTDKDQTEKWRQTAPVARDLESASMDSVLSKFSNMRIQSFADAKTQTGLEKPTVTMVAKYDEGKKAERVAFARAGSDVYAARDGEAGAGKIDTADFDGALKSLDELKAAEPPKPTDTKPQDKK